MKVIYKYLNKFKEPLYISLVLLSIIIIIKLFKKKIVEGHEQHSFSKLAEKGCDKPLNWEYSELNELLFKLEKIQIKSYDISRYKQGFAQALQNGDIGWTNEIVMTYLQSDNVDAPEHLLIEVEYGLYDLILDYAHHYEKKKTELTTAGKWTDVEKSNILLTPKQIMDLMLAAELDIGYILFESYKSATPTFKKIIPEASYKQTFKLNKQDRWLSRNKTFISDGMAPWYDGDNWTTSAYVKYSNSTGGAGALYNTACETTGEQDDCQMCDMTEQIACYKKKWNEYKTKADQKAIELQEFTAEFNVIASTPLPNFDEQIKALWGNTNNTVASCSSLMGYGDKPIFHSGSNKVDSAEAQSVGTSYCGSKMDMAGNPCRFNKAERKKSGDNKGKWKFFCTA
tara:strand:- start:1568 stop:2761 length:1194 start_codon:yes stop_codon:yes gene_type:complete